jgi:hypothetical protein
MDNKLSELSKPVDICNWKMDSWRAAPCNGTEWAKGYFEGWNKYHSMVEEHAPVYSQEYVSALLAELEAKTKRIADMEHVVAAAKCDDELWDAMAHRLKTLEAKLATPVRLPNKHDDEFWFGSTFQVAKFDRAVERAISAAGFKVEGDE